MTIPRRIICLAVIVGAVVGGADRAGAFTWVAEGPVSAITPDYVPASVQFQLFGGSAQCPSGTWLIYEQTPGARVNATYATLTASLLSNRNVRVFGRDDCKIEFIHLLGF